jgi:hypothetical protein
MDPEHAGLRDLRIVSLHLLVQCRQSLTESLVRSSSAQRDRFVVDKF